MRAKANTQKVKIICGAHKKKKKTNTQNKTNKQTDFSTSLDSQALQIICASSVYWTQSP